MLILELDELPRDGKKLQALLNGKRYEKKRRRRVLYVAFAAIAIIVGLYYFVGAGLVAWIAARSGVIAGVAAIVFVVSSARLVLRRRAAPTASDN